jgi:hypothetical protein
VNIYTRDTALDVSGIDPRGWTLYAITRGLMDARGADVILRWLTLRDGNAVPKEDAIRRRILTQETEQKSDSAPVY